MKRPALTARKREHTATLVVEPAKKRHNMVPLGTDLKNKTKRLTSNPRRQQSHLGDEAKKPQKPGAIEDLLAVRQAFSSMEGQHRKRLHEELAKVYGSAMHLCADPDEWLAFCRNPEWTDFPHRPKDADQPDALRFAVRFAVGFPEGKDEKRAASKRATKLSGALQVLFDDKVPAAEVAQKLEERGIEGLNRERASRGRAPTVWTIQCPDEISAKVLSTLKVGERRKVRIDVKCIEGLLIEAKVLKIVKKPTV